MEHSYLGSNMEIEEANTEAYKKAIDALSKYKFLMFGYHAAQWVLLNNLGKKDPNPFKPLVKLARSMKGVPCYHDK